MTFEELLERVPDYAKDLKLNLGNLVKQAELTPNQTWGTVAACAIAARQATLTPTLVQAAAQYLTPENLQAAKTAASLMGMNNIYYRFQHLVTGDKYSTIPARLRMQGIRTHGGDPVDFELFCLAVSAIHNCQACVAAHEKVLLEKGVTEETILASVRLAAVIHALGIVFDNEAAA
jgi:lipoyl-dependent peroxiredoxin subunit D